jgi:hypothetical protein
MQLQKRPLITPSGEAWIKVDNVIRPRENVR